MLACFLDVQKAFDTVWINGLLFKLKHELGVDSKLWMMIRELYKELKGQVIFNGHISRSFDILQGSGQGRILAPFLYKIYINQLLKELCNLNVGICLFNFNLACPSFADDMTLAACYPSCLRVLIELAYQYSCKWRYRFNYKKTSVVAFGESVVTHSKNMKLRNWTVGPNHIEEKSEYVNLGVFKNYIGSFSKNIDENIAKTRKKVGMLFSANFDRRKVNPMIYVKFWKQSCIPTLLFGSEIWSVTSSQLAKLERCQRWFLKKLFHIPDHTHNELLNILSGLPSIALILHQKRLYFLGRVITFPKIPDVVKNIFRCRLTGYLDGYNPNSSGFLHEILYSLDKYDLMSYVLIWQRVSMFPTYIKWKQIVNHRLFRAQDLEFSSVAFEKPAVKLVLTAFTNIKPIQYWSLTSKMPDLAVKFRTMLRVMVNAGLNGGIPWLVKSDKAVCPLCKDGVEDNYHFLLYCKIMMPEWDIFWTKLFSMIRTIATTESIVIVHFIKNLDDFCKVLLLTGGLKLPFQHETNETILRFISVSVHKLVKIRGKLVAYSNIIPNRSSFCFNAIARWTHDDSLSLHHVLA